MERCELLCADVTGHDHQSHFGELVAKAGVGVAVKGLGFFALGVEHVEPVFAAHLVLAQIRFDHLGGACEQGFGGLQLGFKCFELGQSGTDLRGQVALEGFELLLGGFFAR